ncbi:MAG: sensor histidine kinase, partial [Erysipelothrix sp.]|nr:sensor histidine kinase [Erysipelothrix sp.]
NQKISDYPDIDFIIRYDNGSYNLEPDKLTIIFGNAIDNAIEAVQKMDNDANIRIILSENDELIKIFIANPFVVHPVFSDGKLVSIKESKVSGVGMMNIEEATKQVAGTLRYGVKEDMFELVILVHKNGLFETA